MKILPLKKRLVKYLQTRNLAKRFKKQAGLFLDNPFHPGLRTELLEPRQHHIYSFRVTGKYRALFIYREPGTIEIIEINDHYQ